MAHIKLANGQVISTDGNVIHDTTKIKTKTRKGYILYRGKSLLDGNPIVVIATMNTNNEKTGDMVQTWIMRDDMSPLDASKNKQDISVCGMCPHRQSLGGACYVTLHQAPRAIYTAYKNDKYKELDNTDLHAFYGRHIRLGSYGDPAAVPLSVWEKIVSVSSGWTGYTHQLHHKNFNPGILKYCQVSVDTEKEALRVWKQGYKTFRVKTENMPLLDGEMLCVNTTHNISCIDCGLCDGNKTNIAINVHGQRQKRFSKLERII